MNAHGQPREDRQPVSDDMVDAFFDRELGERAGDEFFSRLRANLTQCAEVAKMQRAISLLREPVEAPDVTERVLGALDRRRRFLPERLRRMVTTGRLVAAGVGLAFVLGIAIVDRVAPGSLRLSPAPRPVSNVVSSTAQETAHGMAQLAGSVAAVRVRPAPGESPAPATRSFYLSGLKPGVTSARLLTSSEGGTDSLVVYRGAGPDTRFVLPEAVYIDRNAAIVFPLGHMSAARVGATDWAGLSRDNLFLLPALEPGTDDAARVAPEAAKKPGP